ncbi:hypothetical protein JK635_07505 [Neobacillus sp. YIM B02564]|uniref:Uncharacterized protein n=1 Tax=Neobacillus paridis TaxID=2803862 RepID=A0ABS1TL58_9BACI|nr:hypothetical protein [Neobacillus paridis]MBL4952055.1 hypothetical protein [Neobacillus paridis]
MADTPVSTTQKRLLDLLKKDCDGTYSHAARLLEAMGLPGNACPKGMTWRDVKRLNDEEYLAKFDLAGVNMEAEVVTTKEKTQREFLERKSREQAYKEHRMRRRKLNEKLYQHGYKWVKSSEEEMDGFAGWPEIDIPDDWYLIDPNHKRVSLADAKKQIGWEEK